MESSDLSMELFYEVPIFQCLTYVSRKPFQGRNTGSIPVSATNSLKLPTDRDWNLC